MGSGRLGNGFIITIGGRTGLLIITIGGRLSGNLF